MRKGVDYDYDQRFVTSTFAQGDVHSIQTCLWLTTGWWFYACIIFTEIRRCHQHRTIQRRHEQHWEQKQNTTQQTNDMNNTDSTKRCFL